MCTTCGCSAHEPHPGAARHDHPQGPGHFHPHDSARAHEHVHEHGHAHAHEPLAAVASGETEALHALAHGTVIELERQILAKNQVLAERNRVWLAERGIVALNLLSSPGAGKTALLERTLRMLGETLPLGVIEGDQATSADAERIRAAGCPVVQINTGTGCHLEADMLARGLAELAPPPGALVMIENVGNLVCPALFDLGERAKVVILSVTEGEDKPLKYPHMFRACEVMLLNKIDLLPHLRFEVERCLANARRVNPHLEVLHVSAATGEGMSAWCDWLRAQVRSRPAAGHAR